MTDLETMEQVTMLGTEQETELQETELMTEVMVEVKMELPAEVVVLVEAERWLNG